MNTAIVRTVAWMTVLGACVAPMRQARWVPRPDNPAPTYPEALRDSGLTGDVIVQMRIDRTGGVIPSSLEIINESHPAFVAEVRRVVPTWRFEQSSGDSSEALIRQRIAFKLRSPTESECRALFAREPDLGTSARELRVLRSRLPARRGNARTVAEFGVDTAGRPDVATLRVIETSLPLPDARADLERVLSEWRFAPATRGGCVYAATTRHEFVY